MRPSHFQSPLVYFVLVFVLSCIASSLVAAEIPLLEPQQVIEGSTQKLQQSLSTKEIKGDFDRANKLVRDLLEPDVDFNRVAALVLGKHWRSATKVQKRKFRDEFRRMLVRTYTKAFSEYSGWEIHHLPLRMKEDDQKVIVRTEVLQPGANPVKIDYRMINKKGAWKVYDVIIEGVSLVLNYRNTLKDDIARTGSLDAVIEELARRNDEAFAANKANKAS